MPIYQRKGWPKNKRRVVVYLGGKIREQIHEGSATQAKALEASLLLELETELRSESSGRPNPRDEPSFSVLCLQYAKFCQAGHVAASTWSTRKFQIENLREFFEDVVHEGKGIKPSEVNSGYVDLYKEHRKKPRHVTRMVRGEQVIVKIPGGAPRTINNELKALSCLRTYARDHKIAFGEYKGSYLKVLGKRKAKAWTREQVNALFRVCAADEKGRRLLPIIVFLLNTGCRKGEAIHAQRDWLALDAVDDQGLPKPMLNIEPNEYWQPKSGEAREVPVSDALLPFLKLPPLSDKYLFVHSKPKRGKHLPYRCFPNKTFGRLAKAAGLRGGPHTLRHTFASHFLAAMPDMFLLADVMGHSHTRVTELYSHMLPSHRKEAHNKVNMGPAMGAAAYQAAETWGKKAR